MTAPGPAAGLPASAPPRSQRSRRERERLLLHQLVVLAARSRGLAAILEETRRPGEAVAARHLAELAERTAELVRVTP